MTTWQKLGQDLRGAPRRAVARAEHREHCEGCGLEVSHVLRNVLVDRDAVSGVDPRTNGPMYHLEAFKALCIRCRKSYE